MLTRAGLLISLAFAQKKPRAVGNGLVYVVTEEYNLELDDVEEATKIRDEMSRAGRFPLSKVVDLLEIADRVSRQEVLEGAAFVNPRAVPAWGSNYVCGDVEYGVYVPAELERYVATRARA